MSTSEGVDRRLDAVAEVVRSLVETMRANRLTKIDVEVGDVVIRLRAAGSQASQDVGNPRVDVLTWHDEAIAVADGGHIVSAPMIGTYYSSASPADPPFVRPGDRVEAGQTIGIIEAMKIMNEIASDRSGVVAEVLAANAQPVEYGSPLLRLLLDEDDE
jgi:acetyl-CoA carboxylase biotin carboxyl carrier protein